MINRRLPFSEGKSNLIFQIVLIINTVMKSPSLKYNNLKSVADGRKKKHDSQCAAILYPKAGVRQYPHMHRAQPRRNLIWNYWYSVQKSNLYNNTKLIHIMWKRIFCAHAHIDCSDQLYTHPVWSVPLVATCSQWSLQHLIIPYADNQDPDQTAQIWTFAEMHRRSFFHCMA